MNVLLTGGAGFIGSHLADLLLQEKYDVVIVDNLSSGTRDNIHHYLSENKRCRFLQVDLLDLGRLKKIFQKNKFDVVFHFAANSDILKSVIDPRKDLDDTLTVTWHALECCRIFGVKKFLFASTSAVYGNRKGKLREEVGPFHPCSYYGAAKLAAESFVCAYSHMNDMQSWIIRFPNVIGERATHGVVYDFINQLERNPKRLHILGDGRQKKPYLYVRDLVSDGLFIYRNTIKLLYIYNVGVRDRISVNDIARIICEEMELKNVQWTYSGGPAGWQGDVPEYQYDLCKVHALGWRARYSSSEAVRLAVRRMLKKC
jgi:UDP-glucose 4-epimerase